MPEKQPDPTPEKNSLIFIEETAEVLRFIEEKGFSKEGVSYLLYQAVFFPTYPKP